jgi:hypothetical protein
MYSYNEKGIEMQHKMILKVYCGIGMDSADAHLVSDEDFQEWKAGKFPNALDEEAWIQAVQHAEMYGIYPESDRPEDSDPEDDDQYGSGEYSENIEGWWEEYDPEKHDGLSTTGTWTWK